MNTKFQTALVLVLGVGLTACSQTAADAAQESQAPMAGSASQQEMHGQGNERGEAHAHGSLESLPGGTQQEGRFIGTDGEEIGTVMLADTPNGLLVRIDVSGVEPGFHGVHLHETGQCEPEEGFKTAGGHANPTDRSHGFLVEDGSHGGDLPNAYAHEERHIRTDLFKEGMSLADFQDEDGFAVMVHGGGDDYESQPSGAAGARVACAPFPG